MIKNCISIILCITVLSSCQSKSSDNGKDYAENKNLERAAQTLDSLYHHYGVEGTSLLRETYPFDDQHKATYLASEEQADLPNQYSYLWPFSGTFSAVNILFETTKDAEYKRILDDKVLTGLEEYFDTKREPAAYSSYISNAKASDRFYDDNIWLGIDFTDTYMLTNEKKYLDKAELIWKFIQSGTDDKLGGGIYWCEQKKGSKNTCSNAPGSVYALKLFMATEDSSYFHQGLELYNWTKAHLQDTEDYLFFDNIRLDGSVEKTKYAYNSGQMLQAASLLYKLTKNKEYLNDAQAIAKSCSSYFFVDFKDENQEDFRLIKNGDIWFTAVMLRGFVELYTIDNNRAYLEQFNRSLDQAWSAMRENNGLFNTDWTGQKKDDKKWLLTQAAMVEMYARLAFL
ncbi:glycoside hydrolase family 76 protein [Massilibacteroides sp.]|uniref:glycoside hydrolase family 76 protein n=1 Tax=Massilibacteroides sp. TaxID=2034766 RepID=UPI0026095CB9|nr:glycoside hydrolase family 76 protein [Massilibacteroides sp.]MDD4516199.1 glycoside hydrolase family 76 protein [Massilibacteroides sp.]